MVDDGEGTPGSLFRIHVLDLRGYLRFPGRPIAGLLRYLIADHRSPYTAPVGQFGERLPILRGRRRIDGIRVGGHGRHDREPAANRHGRDQCNASETDPHEAEEYTTGSPTHTPYFFVRDNSFMLLLVICLVLHEYTWPVGKLNREAAVNPCMTFEVLGDGPGTDILDR